MTDRCPVPGCPRPRPASKMLCLVCWRRVSKPTQSAVYKAWRAYSRAAGNGADPEVFRAARTAYFEVRERAIQEAEA